MRAVLALALSLLSWAVPAGEAPPGDLEALRKKIDALKQELEANEATRTEAADALKSAERAISDANRALADAERAQRATQQELARINVDIARARQQLNANRARIREILRARYRNGRMEALRLVLNQQDPNRLSRDLYYYRYIAEAQHKLAQSLATQLETLNALAERVRLKYDELAQLAEERRRQQRLLAAEQSARRQVLTRLSSEIGQQRKQISKLQADEQRLTRLMERLARLSREREAREARERERQARLERERQAKGDVRTPSGGMTGGGKPDTGSPTRTNPTAHINDSLPDAQADGVAFASLKGRLKLPAKGEVLGKFGTARAEGTLWKGVFIRGEAGQPVRAVAGGQVVFADWLRGFGNVLIVDHGGGFLTLYGAAESLLKQVGDRVRGGEEIATSGNSGGAAETGIYFEVRHQGRPVDPLVWAK